ncbi:MAG: carboxypeptidase-like regulatory domain-containing protein [Planctomycetia bacterium]|nr:carboxypeptidase-like regulatory domain-containing protein [Planctomycetia bacterium]
MKKNVLLLLLATVSCLAVLGCSGNGIKTQKTFGTVMCAGEPAVNATVTFSPEADNATGQMAMATTDAEGKFNMRIVSGAGVPVGKYKVTVTPAGYGGPLQAEFSWSKKYCEVNATDLTVDIVEGENNLDLQLSK